MSGGVNEPDVKTELVSHVMSEFNVDEKTAIKIIAFANNFALEKMKKWKKNYRRRAERDE
jgi:peptidyl-tRNA hydrolase